MAALEDHDRGLLVEALEEALRHHGAPELFNSDQCAQFTSPYFTGALKREGIRISMDGKRRATDNIFIERVWRRVRFTRREGACRPAMAADPMWNERTYPAGMGGGDLGALHHGKRRTEAVPTPGTCVGCAEAGRDL